MTSDVLPCAAVRDSDLDTALKVVLSAAEGIVHDFPLKDDPERSPLEGTLSPVGFLRRLLIGRERRAPASFSYASTRQLFQVRLVGGAADAVDGEEGKGTYVQQDDGGAVDQTEVAHHGWIDFARLRTAWKTDGVRQGLCVARHDRGVRRFYAAMTTLGASSCATRS